MADTQSSRQQNSSGNVPIWLVIVIVLMLLCGVTTIALVYQSPGEANEFISGILPTQAAIAEAPSLTPSPEGMPAGPSVTPSWTPRPSSTPYLTPTFVNTAEAPLINTRAAAGNISSANNQIITGSGSGQPVIVPTVTQAIPRATQTSVAATATQAVTQTVVAATATEIAATATRAAATATSAAYTATPIPGIWRGDYYNNANLQDPIVLVRNDPVQTLNNLFLLFDWGEGSPDASINNDNFSVRWRLNANFNSASYLFYAFSDDGIRVYVDDGIVIDRWANASNQVLYGDRSLGAGQHSVRVEYFENEGDARVAVGWQQAVANAWIGEYYGNNNLAQPPTYVQQDNSINFNWFQGSPSALPSDNFSIRWYRNYGFGDAGTFRFVVTTDDGVRIRVDDELILDEWHTVDSPQTYTVNRQLSGTKRVTVEYFEGTGNAQIQLGIARIEQPTATPTNTPTNTPTPTPTPTNTPTP